MTQLGRILRQAILADGPMTLERFMAFALGDPLHGYYMTRDPFGAGGDFVTSPEISQMFGELLGLWAGDLWRRLGAPRPVRVVEFGPGRGALMADFLRAGRAVPGFLEAVDVYLVETSPVLRERQQKALKGAPVAPIWIQRLEDAPKGPALMIANEFFDALPIRQYIRAEDGWRERLVGLDEEGRFVFAAAPYVEPALTFPAPVGAILEAGVEAQRLIGEISQRLASDGGALLAVDYGPAQPSLGDTVQALRRGAPADPLAAPGEADLTAHVDFAGLVRAATRSGARCFGPIGQGAFLRNLGIEARAAQLAQRADEAQRATIQSALHRLTDESSPKSMGALFKVLAVTSQNCPIPAGFEAAA